MPEKLPSPGFVPEHVEKGRGYPALNEAPRVLRPHCHVNTITQTATDASYRDKFLRR